MSHPSDARERQKAVARYIKAKQAFLEATDLAEESRLVHDYADALAACALAGFKTKDELRWASLKHAWGPTP